MLDVLGQETLYFGLDALVQLRETTLVVPEYAHVHVHYVSYRLLTLPHRQVESLGVELLNTGTVAHEAGVGTVISQLGTRHLLFNL